MGNNRDPNNQKQPGEKEPGKFHYNPGNMSGKTAKTCIDESDGANPDYNDPVKPPPADPQEDRPMRDPMPPDSDKPRA